MGLAAPFHITNSIPVLVASGLSRGMCNMCEISKNRNKERKNEWVSTGSKGYTKK